jgi:hypothetical protein
MQTILFRRRIATKKFIVMKKKKKTGMEYIKEIVTIDNRIARVCEIPSRKRIWSSDPNEQNILPLPFSVARSDKRTTTVIRENEIAFGK